MHILLHAEESLFIAAWHVEHFSKKPIPFVSKDVYVA